MVLTLLVDSQLLDRIHVSRVTVIGMLSTEEVNVAIDEATAAVEARNDWRCELVPFVIIDVISESRPDSIIVYFFCGAHSSNQERHSIANLAQCKEISLFSRIAGERLHFHLLTAVKDAQHLACSTTVV